jgi:hypothetical protein
MVQASFDGCNTSILRHAPGKLKSLEGQSLEGRVDRQTAPIGLSHTSVSLEPPCLLASECPRPSLQDRGLRAIRGTELTRADGEALLRGGFLKEVIRDWYIPCRPNQTEGDTTAWYAGLREFVACYAQHRFGDRWHVNAEQSLLLRSGEPPTPHSDL